MQCDSANAKTGRKKTKSVGLNGGFQWELVGIILNPSTIQWFVCNEQCHKDNETDNSVCEMQIDNFVVSI